MLQIRQGDVLLVRVDEDPAHFLEARKHICTTFHASAADSSLRTAR